MRDLSVLIPSRNEEFLKNTIDDVLAAIECDTDIIVVCDGALPTEPIPDHPRVNLVILGKSIGQRAATNLAAKLSNAKYVMKLDAHARVSKGFDAALIKDSQPDWMQIPLMYNLHVFDHACKACGNRTYQGPVPAKCLKCGKSEGFEKVLVWEPRKSRRTEAYHFDSQLHFGYFGDLMKRPEIQAQGDIHDTMSFLGACQFMEREYFWKLDGCDLGHSIWGQWSTEWSCKVWLSGGRVVVNRHAWFSHLFRTNSSFTFPYELKGSQQEQSRKRSRELWLGNTWEGQKYPLSALVEKFWPIPGWSEKEFDGIKEKGRSFAVQSLPSTRPPQIEAKQVEAPAIVCSGPTKSIVFYTDCLVPDPIAEAVQKQILRSVNGHQIVTVSLGKAIDFGENVVIERKRSILTMYYQILAGLEKATGDLVYLNEHDVLYTSSHYDYEPFRKDAYFYNLNVWKVDAATGRALFYNTQQTSGLVAYRETLLAHYQKRIAKIEQNARDLAARGEAVKRDGYSMHMGHEPGNHQAPRGVDSLPALSFCSAYPNLDIRHGGNLTQSRFDKSQFRDPKACLGWTLADEVPGWGKTKGRFNEFLADLMQ